MELFEHLESLKKSSMIPVTNVADQPHDDDNPPFLPEGINAEAPNLSIPLSLPQTEMSQTSSHEAVNIDPPAEIPEKTPPPRHKLLREIKGLQTSYNPISLEDILHANLLPAEFIFNVNDESYPEEAPKNFKCMIKLRDISWPKAHESELQNFLT